MSPPETRRLPAGPLTVAQAAVGYVIAIVCALVAPLVLGPLLGAGADGEADRSYLSLPVQYLLMGVLGVLVIRAWRRAAYRPTDLGLRFPRGATPWLLGVLGGVAFIVIAQVGTRLTASLGEAGQQVAGQLGFGQSVLRDVVVILAMAVCAPLGEELIYRGLIFGGLPDACARSSSALLRSGAFALPALISSVLFAMSHGGEGQSKQVVFLTIFGLIAASLYWWTGSLTVAAFAHSVTNAINVVIIASGGRGLTSPALGCWWP